MGNKSKRNGKPERKSPNSNGNGEIKDLVLVPRGLIGNAIQAITTKEEFLRPEVVRALVEELGKVAGQAPTPQPQAAEPPHLEIAKPS